ncbi:MAG: DUF1926 domain-containing protein [Elusimicrobia bacterium]|nr:DUF1926 domain-containing protein [Elusimicrobiota bacterium]
MIYFLFGIHNHQPVGNFDEVIENAYRMAYQPFLEVLLKHPQVSISLHASGILWEWLKAHHPEYVTQVKQLRAQDRLELIGGGFFEPVLSIIPERDQKGQVLRMKKFLRRELEEEPRGLWLTERVWEPHLAGVLSRLGVEYTIVDDIHFLSAGFSERDLHGYYLTESEGASLKIFPILKKLRYLIPFAEPEQVLQYFKDFSAGQKVPGVALVMADDGEKFGLWPQTHDWVYHRGWLDRFFSLLEQNRDWIQTSTFSNYARQVPPRGWAYLPTGSYTELSEWALGSEASTNFSQAREQVSEGAQVFLRGGYFRNFLSKYPEAHRMYRKMLRVSGKVHALGVGPREESLVAVGNVENAHTPEPLPKRSAIKAQALEHLWRGQCNCAYWHGVFGGLYLPHLRHAIYRHLLRAERLADEAVKTQDRFQVTREDWDADGTPEVLVESREADWYVAPGKGGGIWEWDVKNPGHNLNGVIERRKEAYHGLLKGAKLASHAGGEGARTIHGGVLTKEEGLEQHLFYDWHSRMSLLDHFLHPDTTVQAFARAQYGEQGDFVQGVYQASVEKESGTLRLVLSREGRVWVGQDAVPIFLQKALTFHSDGSWSWTLLIQNRGPKQARVWFGSEMILALPGTKEREIIEEKTVTQRRFEDPSLGFSVLLTWELSVGLWVFPLYTISQSEGGFERTHQGFVLLAHRQLELNPNETISLKGSAKVDRKSS